VSEIQYYNESNRMSQLSKSTMKTMFQLQNSSMSYTFENNGRYHPKLFLSAVQGSGALLSSNLEEALYESP